MTINIPEFNYDSVLDVKYQTDEEVSTVTDTSNVFFIRCHFQPVVLQTLLLTSYVGSHRTVCHYQ